MDSKEQARSVADYAGRVTVETWTEARAEEMGTVTGKVWTRAIQTALDENTAVFLPDREFPGFIFR